MNNIVLIGFMGVGKGTVARELAKKTGKLLLDTDDLIETAQNRKIREIFEGEGEEYFRALEKNLAKNLAQNVRNCVIAGGGGFAKVKNLKKIGKVIYLKSSFEAIMQRIKNSENAEKKLAKRPLLNDLERAKKLHEQREEIYRKKADITVDVEGKTPKQIAKEILNGKNNGKK